MTMITPSYLGETIEYSSLHACRSTLEDPTHAVVSVLGPAPLWGCRDQHWRGRRIHAGCIPGEHAKTS